MFSFKRAENDASFGGIDVLATVWRGQYLEIFFMGIDTMLEERLPFSLSCIQGLSRLISLTCSSPHLRRTDS